MTLKAIITANQ